MWEVILNDPELTERLRRRIKFLREKLSAPSITTVVSNKAPSKEELPIPDKGVGSIAKKSQKSQAVRSKVPNDLEEVYAFGAELKLPRVECEKFWLHFENNGWKQSGKTPMKDWKLALRNWRINWCERSGKNPDSSYKPKEHRIIVVEDPVEISEPGAVVSDAFKQKMDRLLGKMTGGD